MIYMSEKDIKLSYKQAKNKKEQIVILSELNDCDPFIITEILKLYPKDTGLEIAYRRKRGDKVRQIVKETKLPRALIVRWIMWKEDIVELDSVR